jgi:hypothetical protein
MQRSRLVVHPLFVLACAALGILIYVAWTRWRFPGGDLSRHYIYVLPIIVPFVAFIFDRAKTFRDASLVELVIDSAVVVASIMRMLSLMPFVSGHALFLTYAIARPGSRLTKITAALVMLQVIYMKFVLWHDWVTPVAGTILGLLAASIVRRFQRQKIARLRPLPNTQ